MNLNFPSLTEYESVFLETLSFLDRQQVPERIWKKDYKLWSQHPAEVANRLGWLDVMNSMRKEIPELKTFGDKIRQDGTSDVVLLGMGGSSLGAEVLNRTFGNEKGYPQMTVLDSVIPEAVNSVSQSIDPAKTQFLVSSKSGTTAETRALFDYFYAFEFDNCGPEAGHHFTVITDRSSPLDTLGREKNIRRIFDNPEELGGRYSVLSYFGLVPAITLGIDVEELLSGADAIRMKCGPDVKAEDNDGCRLGAYLAVLAKKGRDKVTFITSPSLESFSLWAEQLIAESTGKNGKGLIPVVGEPQVEGDLYGIDRQFVYLRSKDNDNGTVDSFIKQVMSSGQPVAMVEIENNLELGALFYLWEFAVAIAGMLIGVQPFNQPDVQSSKDATKRILEKYEKTGQLPSVEVRKSFYDMLSQAKENDYFAIMAYLQQTPRTDSVFYELRRRVLKNYKLATTLGYGPRFLHSTGQLHKGGPNKGLFLQVVSDSYKDILIPGRSYSFGTMSDAESLGDLEALRSLNRSVVRVALDSSHIDDILE
jgi:glucose-6-phosphate isomerase